MLGTPQLNQTADYSGNLRFGARQLNWINDQYIAFKSTCTAGLNDGLLGQVLEKGKQE